MKNNRDGIEIMMRDGDNGEGMTITKLGCKKQQPTLREFREDFVFTNFFTLQILSFFQKRKWEFFWLDEFFWCKFDIYWAKLAKLFLPKN
jgi:hypothetical protein